VTSAEEFEQLPSALTVWPAFMLRALANRVTVICDRLVDEWGVTLRQFGLLSLISTRPGQSQQAIGSQLAIDRTTIVALVDQLEALGFLERRRRQDDRRIYGLHLTSKGRRSLPAMERVVAGLHDEFLAPLDDRERAQLSDLMTRLLQLPR
jgi:DNA-binding MarR family transcriptional regulator